MISEQVKLLWSLLPHPSPDHVVRMFARNGDRKTGDYARSPGEMQRFVDSATDLNVYVSMNPTKSAIGTRVSTKDVTHWSFFVIDADPVCQCTPEQLEQGIECVTCSGDADPLGTLDEALLWLGKWHNIDFKRRPPIIVDSGRGAQAWLRLPDIIVDDKQQEGRFIGMSALVDGTPMEQPTGICTRKTARKSMGYWLKQLAEHVGTFHGCRIDTSVSDLPRVMRMPGTTNQKTGRPTKILTPSTEMYTWLPSTLVELVPPATFTELDPGEVPPGTPWQTVFSKLTMKAQNYLTRGKEEPGRHETLWHTLTKLSECGIDRAQARAAVGYANRILGDELALPSSELDRVTEQVYGMEDL